MARTPDPTSRDALLEAARAEFCKAGLDRARVEDIARRAGVAKGSFYLHFASKEDAFELILERVVGAMDELFAQAEERERALAVALGEHTAEDFVTRNERFEAWRACHRQFDLALLETIWRNRELLAIVESESASSARWRAVLVAFRRRVVRHLLGDFFDCQKRGTIKAGLHPDAVTDLVVGAYESFVARMARMKTKPDLAAWSETVHEVIHNGILPAAKAAGASRRPPRR